MDGMSDLESLKIDDEDDFSSFEGNCIMMEESSNLKASRNSIQEGRRS